MKHISLLAPPGATRHQRWLVLFLLLCCSTMAAVAQTTTIGSTAVPVVTPATSSYLYGPIYRSANDAGSTFNWSRYAHLYTAAELSIPTGAVITQLAWLKSDAGTVTGNNTFNVLLENSALTTLGTTQTWGTLTTTPTSVYSSTTQQVVGAAGAYFSVTLTQPFVYTGGNLLVLTDWQKQGTATAAVNFVTNLASGFGLGAANSTALTSATALTTTYGNRRPTLQVTYTPGGPCTSPPTAGTTTATAATVCAGATVSLSLTGASYGSGQTYQWQESTNGTTFTDIAGATLTYYTIASVQATRTYRARLTCSGQSATSTPVTVTLNPAAYTTLPVVESFEGTWISACNTNDAPNNSWRTTPNSGDASWRRDDDGATAGWTSPTIGVYTPTGSQGTHSARFHSYYAGVNAVGTFDLYVNMSAAGTKRLAFDYLNTAGNDSLYVQVSNDGGLTFGAPQLGLGISGTVAQAWQTQAVVLSGTSATTVIRFRTKVTTAFTSDIGLDNVRLESTSGCLTPVSLAVTGTTATTGVVSWVGGSTSGTYTVYYGPTGFNPNQPSTGTNQYTTTTGITASTYTIPGLTASTAYQFYVQQVCSPTSSSGIAGPQSFTTACLTPVYATLPITESFENTWLSRCDTREVPSNSWRNTPITGNNSWRRDDDGAIANWTSPTSYGYTPVASQGLHSARFHSGFTSAGIIGTMDLFADLSPAGAKRLTFDFVNTSGTDSLTVDLSNDGGLTFSRLARYALSSTFTSQTVNIVSTSATAVVRFRARADFGSTDIGIDNIRLESATGCLTPANLTATTTQTGATLSWLPSGSGTYTVVYGLTGFNPATGGTTVSGITGNSTTITGLAGTTAYQFYVTQVCSPTSSSPQAGPYTFTTSIANDDCSGAINLPIQYGTCVTQTSSDNTAATASANVPAPTCASYQGGDMWFKVTVPVTGTVTVQTVTPTAGSNVSDTGMTMYSGTCGNLTDIGCDDDSAGSLKSLLTFTNRTPGEILYIRVWAFGGSAQGLIAVCATSPSNCAAPTAATATNVTNFTATLNWTAPTTTPVAGNTYELEYGPQGFTQGTGTSVTGLNATSTTTYNLTNLTANTPYCFYVRQNCGTANGSSTWVGPICFTTLLTAPANDEPCGAFNLTTAAQTNTNVGATTTTAPVSIALNGLPVCGGSANLPKDVWYTFIPTGTSTALTFTGVAAGAVRVFSLSGACATGTYSLVGCQAAANATTSLGTVTFTGLTAGTRYYLAVSGYASTTASGSFTVLGTALATRTQAETGALVVFPNPSNTGQLSLRLSNPTAGSATLLNALGQVVLTKTLSAGAAEQLLNTKALATGVYTLRVQQGSDVLTRKVVLE